MDVHFAPGELQRVNSTARQYPIVHADLERLVAAPDCYFEAGFAAFVQRLSHAFQAEEQRLQGSGSASLMSYCALHAEVIRLMHHAQSRNMGGDYALARKIIGLLPGWLGTHAPRTEWQANPALEKIQAAPARAQPGTLL
jgi:hypothetical protein